MVNVELGDMEGIARCKSNGNLSKYLRNLVDKDKKEQQILDKLSIYQLCCFLVLGLTLVVFALAIVINFFLVLAISMFTICGLMFTIYGIIGYRFKIYVKKEVKRVEA